MTGQFVAQILQVGFNFAPKNWATCSAQQMGIAQNQALFSLLGTTYGGNGVTTFGLPDLRGRVAIGQGQSPGFSAYTLGEKAGSESVSITAANLPMHIHNFSVSNAVSSQSGPGGGALAQGGLVNSTGAFLYGSAGGTTLSPGAIANAGNSQPLSIMQPYNTLLYIICLYGIYPSRN